MTCNLLTQDTVLSWAVLNGPVLISVMWLAVSCDRLSRKASGLETFSVLPLTVLDTPLFSFTIPFITWQHTTAWFIISISIFHNKPKDSNLQDICNGSWSGLSLHTIRCWDKGLVNMEHIVTHSVLQCTHDYKYIYNIHWVNIYNIHWVSSEQ